MAARRSSAARNRENASRDRSSRRRSYARQAPIEDQRSAGRCEQRSVLLGWTVSDRMPMDLSSSLRIFATIDLTLTMGHILTRASELNPRGSTRCQMRSAGISVSGGCPWFGPPCFRPFALRPRHGLGGGACLYKPSGDRLNKAIGRLEPRNSPPRSRCFGKADRAFHSAVGWQQYVVEYRLVVLG